MSEITAVILAGGIGKRFTPFISDKTLFPFMGKSPLERTLEMVVEAGISKVVLAMNRYNQQWIESARLIFPQLDIQFMVQDTPKGMGHALISIKEILPKNNIIVMNAGDMVDNKLLKNLIATVSGKYAVLTGMRTPTYQPLGYFQLTDEGKIVGIIEKPGADNMPSDLGSLVFHYFSDVDGTISAIETIQNQSDDSIDDVYEQALTEIMQAHPVDVFIYEGPWQKLKYGFHVLDMVEYLLRPVERYISPDAQLAGTAVINGEVVIEAGAKVLDGAIIQGPCWIGPEVIVGNNALVRQSIVESGSVIGFSSEVVRSYVGANCDLHHAYVGDSALENNVHFGYGAHTANYRFDHQPIAMKWITGATDSGRDKLGALIAQGSEVGVNASIMPGICIGQQSAVFPSTVVYEPVPDRSIVKEKRQQSIVSQAK